MLERDNRIKILDLKIKNADKQQQQNNHLKVARNTLQQRQDETETNTDLSDLQLNNSIINVIEQHMPIELFMETPPLTGDCSSTHSTNSMCSTGGISADAELPNNNQQTTTNAAVLALDASATTQTMTADMQEDFNATMDNDSERPLVLVIITDYDMQQ
uniref:Uncharacterized protein n=1 Tax=Bactrocera latifrons TaxID=174628 RepID=A0A0K8W1V9_BACLA